jgi:hypothetical protein
VTLGQWVKYSLVSFLMGTIALMVARWGARCSEKPLYPGSFTGVVVGHGESPEMAIPSGKSSSCLLVSQGQGLQGWLAGYRRPWLCVSGELGGIVTMLQFSRQGLRLCCCSWGQHSLPAAPLLAPDTHTLGGGHLATHQMAPVEAETWG